MNIFTSVVGSTVRGYATEKSDRDTVTVYAEPLTSVLSLYGDTPKGKQQHGEDDHTTYELRHFCRLLVKGNPTVYEAIFSPIIEQESLAYLTMRENIEKFMDTNAIYAATRGFCFSTITDMEKNPNTTPKKLVTALQIARMGIELVSFGTVRTLELIGPSIAWGIRDGREGSITYGHKQLTAALADLEDAYNDVLPRQPNRQWIDNFLYSVYTTDTFLHTNRGE